MIRYDVRAGPVVQKEKSQVGCVGRCGCDWLLLLLSLSLRRCDSFVIISVVMVGVVVVVVFMVVVGCGNGCGCVFGCVVVVVVLVIAGVVVVIVNVFAG